MEALERRSASEAAGLGPSPSGSDPRGENGHRAADNSWMQQRDGRLVFSPSDLNAFLACPHLTTLWLGVARGELPKPFRHNPYADLIRRKGEEWEAAYLARLRAEGREIVEPRDAAATEEALRGGADVVYQAILTDGRWLGKADFVERQEDGSYEVVDTKLARHARPAHVLQLSFYSEQVAWITGREPRAMHVVAGTGERESFRPEDFAAYYRRVRERFLGVVRDGRSPTYPYPVAHCSLCEFLPRCEEQWERDDHLTLVAGVSRLQHDRLVAGGIHTMEALGAAAPGARVPIRLGRARRGRRPDVPLHLGARPFRRETSARSARRLHHRAPAALL